MNRSEQKEKRRQEILSAGLDLFIRKGYAATRTAEIAQIAGMSEGLLFHYFETKEKLYLALIELANMGKDHVFSQKELPPLRFFEETAKTILNYIVKEPAAAKLFVLMSRSRYDASLPESIRQACIRENDLEASVKQIQKGQREGRIREGEPVALATAFFMSIQGIAEHLARNPELPAPEPEWIVDIIRRKS